jgi:transposase
MRRLEIRDREIMQIALRNEILRSEEARYDHRLHGVLLVSQGMSCYEVGEIFGHHPTTIQRWIRTFETRGFSGLEDQERPRRPQRLTPQGLETVNRDLRRSPREFGYTQNLWDGKLLSHHIAETQKVVLGGR